MHNSLKIEIRNKNFGPVKNGHFFAAQIEAVKKFGIGDGLFAAPRNYQGDEQYGYENLIQPIIIILFKDGKVQKHLKESDQELMPSPGKSGEIQIDLLDNRKISEIENISLNFHARSFGHSRGGGCGMSCNGNLNSNKIGSATLSGDRINTSGIVIAEIELSDRWDLNIASDDLVASEKELININFLRRRSDINNQEWKNVELIENWRSVLTPFWGKADKYAEKYNLHRYALFVMPIKAFDAEKEGWVVGINGGSALSEVMKQHKKAFLEYAKQDEYKKEEQAYQDHFYGRSSVSMSK